MFKIDSILSHCLYLVNVSFRSAFKKCKVILDCCIPPAPNATPFDQPIPPKSDNNVPSPTQREEDAFYAGLQCACPTAVALSLHAKHSDSFVPKCVSGTAPMPLDQLYDPKVSCDVYNDVMLHCATVDTSVTEEQVLYVVQQTVNQSKSKLWFSMRAGRVTASTFYADCHTRIEKPAMSVLRSICMPNAHRFSSAATDWGKTHESVARDQYEALHAVQHRDSVYQASGLFLSIEYSMYGASPDGLVSTDGLVSPDGLVQCTCFGEGLVEIKCPYTLRESSDFGQLAWMCLVDDIYCLSRSHRHYFQVQMQLFVTNKMYCDFVVWSPEGLFVERIYPHREWWVKWSGQGMLFHSKCYMPELCVQYFSKKTILGTSTSQNVIQHVAASESVASGNYCVCRGVDDGTTMICCDDEN